jgi:hypothetical protein
MRLSPKELTIARPSITLLLISLKFLDWFVSGVIFERAGVLLLMALADDLCGGEH